MTSRLEATNALNTATTNVINAAADENTDPSALAALLEIKNSKQMLKSCVDSAFQQA